MLCRGLPEAVESPAKAAASPATDAAEASEHRDHTNHPHPHLQTCSTFEVPNYLRNEHTNRFHKPQSIIGVGVGWFVWSPEHFATPLLDLVTCKP